VADTARPPRASDRVTPLGQRLAARITENGPLTIADFMAACLLDPLDGYYTTRDPLGTAGDFTTAPEINQMFGELLGLALAQSWLDQGTPGNFVLAELGPGRGTLMADALRATSRVPGFNAAANLHLVEISAALRARQAEILSPHNPQWHDSIDTLPDGPLFLIANEFFDALPIRQFQRDGAGWAERVVGLSDGELMIGLTPATPFAALDHRLEDTNDGDIVETCAPAQTIAAEIAARITGQGGTALIIDYGDWRSLGDTLQAVQGHAPKDPLADPGKADLTAHVDFEALAIAANDAGAAHSRLTPQGVFLERLGISARAEALSNGAGKDQRAAITAAFHRLTHPSEMGTLFKALAITQQGAPLPAGFAP